MYKLLSWIAVIFWMALIFYLSHQPAAISNELSSGITELIVDALEKLASQFQFNIGELHHIVRKNAHFFAYLMLGILVLNGLRRSGVNIKQGAGIALLICILYAVTDEVHQLYIPGRSGEVRDVLIDSAGASLGIMIYLIVSRLAGRIKDKRTV
ncbi:VanZ family protein [Oceanobacillus sojae]|uniref:VanZ family protein n=1 Tax=Oceanobacillus sojae TaxID=582851 RepID=UPI0009884AF9|nr:VanZ family protein [Oceanobacillus sojae]MCT1905546.1 VanZ family protein [Oceanobacillus sojae]